MASDVYRKTGRGGSGNFYSQENIDRVTKKDTEVGETVEIHHLPYRVYRMSRHNQLIFIRKP